MRQLAYQSEFDAVLNLYTSFGYFSPRANLDVLRRMARALKPGGRILIDHRDRDRDARLSGRWWDRAADGTLALQEMRFDRSTGRWSGEWTFVSPNGRRSVRPLGVFDDPSSRALGPVPRHGGLYCIRAGDGVVEELGHRGGHVERRWLGRWREGFLDLGLTIGWIYCFAVGKCSAELGAVHLSTGRASSTWRTLRASASGVKGF
jgi:SAM-dependent methyltransferase